MSTPSISVKDVKALRDATGSGMMDAKRALQAADGDFEEAAEILKRQGLSSAGERVGREAKEGAVALAKGDNVAALVHLRSETDFSARSPDFLACVNDIADAVLADGPTAAASFSERIDELRLSKKENIALGAFERLEAAEGNLLDTYLHLQDGRGVNGVIVEAKDVPSENLHQVSLHVAFARPRFLDRSEVPEEETERQRASAEEFAADRPPAAREKIIAGRLNSYFAECVLLDQGLHGEKTLVRDTLAGGQIVRFALAALG